MRIAIVEDEKALAEDLADMLYSLREQDIMLFESGEAFLFAFDDHPFDLVFLDIQMNRMNGLDTARKLREIDRNIAIVFLTNDASFVFDGYEVDAIRYWLKPVKREKLAQLLETLDRPRPYLIWNVNSEVRKIYQDDILYLESDKHYVLCHTRDEILRMKAGFKEVCDQLSDDFLLIYRSYCVNLNHVHALLKEGCRMDNGDVLAVSRNKKVSIQEALMRKCREDLSWKS